MKPLLKGNPSCTNCDLYRSSDSVCIMGAGKKESDIMIILDSPGPQETKEGVPIAARMRTYLSGLLKEAGIKISDCYITNTVKCQVTVRGKGPKVSEIKACAEYLEREMELIRPKYVLLMGATALKAIIGKGKITEIHGQPIEKDGVQYMPVFAPGVAFRDPKRLAPLQADLARFKKLTTGHSFEPPKLDKHVVTDFDTFNDMIRDLKRTRVISVDIETTGLNRFEHEITVIGFGLAKKQWILPLQFVGGKFLGKKDIQKQMMEIVEDALNTRNRSRKTKRRLRKEVITHNGKFDNLFVRAHYGIRFPITFDTMIAAYILDENTPNGLNYLSRTVLGAPEYDIDLNLKKGQKHSKADIEKFYDYLGYDVLYTRDLRKHFRKQLKEQSLTKIYNRLMMPVYRVYEDVETEGVYIRRQQFDEVERYLNQKLADVDKKLARLVKKHRLTITNWGSPKQVGEVLFGQLKLPILEKTPTGNPATGESILKRLAEKHPVPKVLMERRGIMQQISFFIDGWKKRMHGDKIYPGFNIHTTVTGRTSSNGPNLQQVPRDKRIRSLIGAPPGWTLVEIDYSQVELRIVAELSGDPKMKEVYRLGRDIHSNTALSLSTATSFDEVTKELREKAKAVNFGFVYGMGHSKFREYARDNYDLHISDREAMEYRKRFFEEYSTLPDWHEKQRRLARTFKRVVNLIGRVRRLQEVDSPDGGLAAEAERQAINSPVQSLASDMLLMSLIEISETISNDECRIIGSVHDAGLYIIKNEHLNEIIPKVKRIMERPSLMDVFGLELTIPITVDVDIGVWGDGVSWNGEHIIPGEDSKVTLVPKEGKK